MKRHLRIALSLTLLGLATAISVSHAHADGPPPLFWDERVPETENEFLCTQHVAASEGRYQSPEALLQMARAAVTKGPCFRSRNWYSSWGAAVDAYNDPNVICEQNYHCQGYFAFETIPPEIREPIAVAANRALTEIPRVPRFHFTATSEPIYSWWHSLSACPNGYFEVDRTRYC